MYVINRKARSSRSRDRALTATACSAVEKAAALCLGLALLLTCGPWGAAADVTPSFPSQEVAAVLGSESDHILTQAELKQEFQSAGFQRYPQTAAKGNATVRDLLSAFTYALEGQFCTQQGDKFVYPAGDSMWLSASEWASLMDSLDQPVTVSTVRILLDRTQRAQTFLSTHSTISTYRSYQETINAFLPEFSQLTASNQEAIQFWLRSSSHPADFSTVLHECAHEQSARLSGVFSGRSISTDGLWWGVNWSKFPQHMYFYDLRKQAWVSLQTATPLPSSCLLESSSDTVKSSALYQKYMAEDSTANLYGIYGMVQELCSTAIDIRVEAVSGSLRHDTKDENLQSYYWWKGATLHYLKALQAERPRLYDTLMRNSSFTELLSDTFLYADTQLSAMQLTASPDAETLVMKSYAEELSWTDFCPGK